MFSAPEENNTRLAIVSMPVHIVFLVMILAFADLPSGRAHTAYWEFEKSVT
jgi:hypothetical protein